MAVSQNEAYSAAAALIPSHDGNRFGMYGTEEDGWRVVLADEDGNPIAVVLVDSDGNAEEE